MLRRYSITGAESAATGTASEPSGPSQSPGSTPAVSTSGGTAFDRFTWDWFLSLKGRRLKPLSHTGMPRFVGGGSISFRNEEYRPNRSYGSASEWSSDRNGTYCDPWGC